MAGVTEAALFYRSGPEPEFSNMTTRFLATRGTKAHRHPFLRPAEAQSQTCHSSCSSMTTDPGVGRFGHMSNLTIAMKC